MTAEFDQLVAEFEQFQASIKNVDDRFENLAGMREELASLEVTATSPDRSVTVVAGPGGAVTDVRLTESALQLGPHGLGRTIMSTLQAAVADAARQQAAIVQEHVGDDAPVLDQVLETQAEVTGTPVEELRDRIPARARETDEPEPPLFRETAPPPPPSNGDTFLSNLSDEED